MGFFGGVDRGALAGAAAFAASVAAAVGCAGGDGDFEAAGVASFNPGQPPGGMPPGGPSSGTGAPGSSTTGEATSASTTSAVGTSTDATADETTITSGGPCVDAVDCDDADPCTDDNCINAACSNVPRDCSDDLMCTVDTCNATSGVCENLPDDTLCGDDDLCAGASTCDPVLDCVPGTPVVCQDMDACTVDACVPTSGMCTFDDLTTCNSADGCCPFACTAADTDCVCTNLAPTAVASSNGGGQDAQGFGPAKWNDGADEASCGANCTTCYGWIMNSSTPEGSFMEYTWPNPVVIGSTRIDTTGPGLPCNSLGRYLPSGRAQWWNGAAWVDAGTWAGATGDVVLDFDPPLTTTRLRLFDVTAPPGGTNSLAYEWFVYTPAGCAG